MSKSKDITGGLSPVALFLGLLMLGVSTYHATTFLFKLTDIPHQKAAMLVTVVSLLASSHVMARLVGLAMTQKKAFIILLCGGSIFAVEAFSIGTSAISMNSRAIEGIRSENLKSPEYRMAMQNIANYQSQIDSVSSSIARLPANYVTKRQELQTRLGTLQNRLERAQKQASSVNVSTTGKAIDGMSARWGITAEDIALTASLMLSIVPLVMGVGIGSLSSGGAAKEGKKSKKSQRPNLRSVA